MNPRNYFHFLQKHNQWALPATRIAILIFFCIGLVIVVDYGISWDEPPERHTGLVNVRYIIDFFHLNSFIPAEKYEWGYVGALHDFYDRYYGSWFQVLAISLETLLGLKDMYHIVILHHVLNLLMYTIGIYYLSQTIQYLFNTPWLTLLTTLVFITQPRFFAEAFYNSKDIVLLSVVLIALYFITKMILTNEKNYYWLLAALFTGLAIATRIIALALFVEVCIVLLFDVIFKNQQNIFKRSLLLPYYVGSTIVFTIIFWPYLWNNPKENFIATWEIMKIFHWDGEMLFMGQYVRSTNLPWNYIPQWVLITTPILILIGIAWGMVAIIVRLFKLTSIRETYLQLRIPLLFAGLFIGPVAMVIYLHSVLYDGWRHLYFISAGGILLTAYGIWAITQWRKRAFLIKMLVGLICIQICTNLYSIITLHPYQNVYFNTLAGDNLRRRYEMDYWGLTFREGFEYILKTDPRDSIKVCNVGHWASCDFHKPYLGKTLISTSPEDCDYYLSTYRWHPDNYTDLQEVYTIKAGKDTIMSVFKKR